MGDILVLGDMVFDPTQNPFAVPSKIGGGSGQHLGVMNLIGGARTLDAMGPNPDQITWSGRWRAPNAVANNQAMIAMAESGQALTVTWGENFYNVAFPEKGYTYSYISQMEIDYTVTLTVDPQVDATGGATLGSSVDDDMMMAMGALDDFL